MDNLSNGGDWLVDGALDWTSCFEETTGVGLIGVSIVDETRGDTIGKIGAGWIGVATVDETRGATIGWTGATIMDETRGDTLGWTGVATMDETRGDLSRVEWCNHGERG
jgi:hypothetical protein